jgi:uncharacterized protein (DUF433 family)
MGLNAEAIVERMGNVNLAQVYAALTYSYSRNALRTSCVILLPLIGNIEINV